MISVGKPHPFGILPKDGACLKIHTPGLIMVWVCPYPKDQEIEYFEELVSYGIYKSDTFPYGLIIWKFGNNCLIETPFNILKDDEVSSFLSDDSNALTRVLIDEKGIVRSVNVAGLQWGVIKELQEIWGNESLNWPEYETKLAVIIQQNTTQKLWDKSKKYMHMGYGNISNN
jgi:hypothetical protein